MGALYAAVDMHRLTIGHGRPNPRPVGLLTASGHREAACSSTAPIRMRRSARRSIQRQHTFGDFSLGEGATPLMRAAKSGDIEVVKLLVAAAPTSMRTMPSGANAMMFAAGLGWRNGSPAAPSYDQGTDAEAIETLQYLQGLGLDLNAQDKDGNTALHAAIGGRASEPIIAYLITDAMADTTVRNGKGQTPYEFAQAKRNGAEAAVAMLDKLGLGPSGSAATAAPAAPAAAASPASSAGVSPNGN